MNKTFRSLIATILLAGGAAVAYGFTTVDDVLPEDKPIVTHKAIIKVMIGTVERDVEVELYGQDAPKTVANFVGLANKNFYDGVLFHRVVPGFVVQAGDPKSKNPAMRDMWGQGGGSIYGDSTFVDELNPNAPSYKLGYQEGVLAMANRGPNTNTSQFFIMLKDNSSLPKNYTIFGRVRTGMDAVHEIEKIETNERQQPLTPVVIKSVRAESVIGASSNERRQDTGSGSGGSGAKRRR